MTDDNKQVTATKWIVCIRKKHCAIYQFLNSSDNLFKISGIC